MKALKITIIIVIAFALICLTAKFMENSVKKAAADTYLPSLEEIPTRKYIQQLLVATGYDIGPKGVDGEIGTDTNAAWGRAECDQFAVEMMERQGY